MKTDCHIARKIIIYALLWFFAPVLPGNAQESQVTSPEDYFGFQMGADRELARWDKLVEYYDLLAEQSDRLHVVNMGPSTMGNPFLFLFISSPDNLARFDDLRHQNAILSDPRGYAKSDIDGAIENGRAVIVQSMGLHSS